MRPLLLSLLGMFAACATAGEPLIDPDGSIPGGPDSGPVGVADSGPTPDAPPSACDLRLSALHFDFEGTPQGFTHNRAPGEATSNNTWPFDSWERGPANVTCPSGSQCFGTNLEGNYIQCQRAYLESPDIDLTDCVGQGASVTFRHYYDFWTGSYDSTTWYDGGRIEVSRDGGTSWEPLDGSFPGTILINPDQTSSYECSDSGNFSVHNKPGFVGSSGGWVSETYPIGTNYLTSEFRMRFSYASGVSSQTTNAESSKAGTAAGWYIDDIRFE